MTTAPPSKIIEDSGRAMSLVARRNRRAGGVTRGSKSMEEWRVGDRVGRGLSNYLDHLQKAEA